MKKENNKTQIKNKQINIQNQPKQKTSTSSINNQPSLNKKINNKYNKITTENKLFPNITRSINKKHLSSRPSTIKKIDNTNSSLYLSTANTIIDSNKTKSSINTNNNNNINKHTHKRSNSFNEEFFMKTKIIKKTECEKIIEVIEEIIELINNRQFLKYILNKYKNDKISDDVMFNYVKSVRNKANNLNNDLNNLIIKKEKFNNNFVYKRSFFRLNCYKIFLENIFNSMIEIKNFDIELYNKLKIIKLKNKNIEKKNKSSKNIRKNYENNNNKTEKKMKHFSTKNNLNEFKKKFNFQTNDENKKKHSKSKNKHHKNKHHKSKEKKIFDFNESEDEIIENDNEIIINEDNNNNNNELNLIEKKIFKNSIKFNKKKSLFYKENNKTCNNNHKFNLNNENVVDSSENENY